MATNPYGYSYSGYQPTPTKLKKNAAQDLLGAGAIAAVAYGAYKKAQEKKAGKAPKVKTPAEEKDVMGDKSKEDTSYDNIGKDSPSNATGDGGNEWGPSNSASSSPESDGFGPLGGDGTNDNVDMSEWDADGGMVGCHGDRHYGKKR